MTLRFDFSDALQGALSHSDRVTLRVEGTSMTPFIRNGASVRVTALEKNQLQLGDIVLLQLGPSIAVHRVIDIDGDSVQTHGDSSRAPDARVHKSAILGRATHVRSIFGWLPAPHGRVLGTLIRASYARRRRSR